MAAVTDRVEERGLPPRRLMVVLSVLVWMAYGIWIWRAGIRTGVDTGLYSIWGDKLIQYRFNVASFLNQNDFYIPPFLYLGWITLVAVLKSVAGASWMKAVVFLNWLALGSGAYAILSAVRQTTASAAGLLLTVILFAVAGDLLIFSPFVLSDLIFWGMATVTLAAGCLLAVAEPDRDRLGRFVAAVSALVLIALFFRPGGLTLIIFWAVTLLGHFARRTFDRLAMPIAGAVVILAVLAVAWHAAIMVDPSSWPFTRLRPYFAVLSEGYRSGVLVDAPESDLMVAPAVTWIGAMRLTTEKLLYFLTPWLPSYSRAHTLMNLAFFVPAYGLTIAAVMNRSRLSEPQRRATLILMLFVISASVSHALIQLDYDHRYRLPMLSALMMLAAIGLESIRRPERAAW